MLVLMRRGRSVQCRRVGSRRLISAWGSLLQGSTRRQFAVRIVADSGTARRLVLVSLGALAAWRGSQGDLRRWKVRVALRRSFTRDRRRGHRV